MVCALYDSDFSANFPEVEAAVFAASRILSADLREREIFSLVSCFDPHRIPMLYRNIREASLADVR